MWQVYDTMHPQYGGYGPLPVKRWEREPKFKLVGNRWIKNEYKLKYKTRIIHHSIETTDKYNERRAIEYAKWLAQRDGITIPDESVVQAEWTWFVSSYYKTRRRFWNGTREVKKSTKRIKAVQWGHNEIRHYNRTDRHSSIYTQFVADLTIPIPHWDFEHPPIDGIDTNISEDIAA